MKKIIILQLARLGDIVQTLPAVQGLKKAHPGCELTLVTRGTFADAARLSPHVDKLVEFPTQDILGPVASDPKQKAESLARLIRWVADHLLIEEYDLLLNLTFSPASAYMASLIKATERRGVIAASNPNGGPYVIHDAWSQYFFAQVVEHNINILHVNDLFTRIAGVTEGAWPLELAETKPAATPPARETGKPRIGIQLTASSDEKTLNYKVWAKVCERILATHTGSELVFFGSGRDLKAIQAVLGELETIAPGLGDGRCHIAAGRLKFHENPAWIRTCDWIVAPDTAIVHVASACETRIVQISVGGVRPDETGPYGAGHFVIYPAKADAEQLSEEIARIVRSNGEEKARPVVAQAITRMTPTTSGIARNEILAHNFIQDEVSNFFMQAYYLLGEFRCAGRQEDIAIPRIGDPEQSDALDRLVNVYDALCTTRRLAEYGQHYCLKMLENLADAAMLKELMAHLTEIENMLTKLQSSVFLVKPLIDTWWVAKDLAYSPATETGALEEMLALTEGCYRELGQNVDIVQQLLQTAVEAAQGKLNASPSRSRELMEGEKEL